jgi:selenocysteine lyase/cysteine desulfurase
VAALKAHQIYQDGAYNGETRKERELAREPAALLAVTGASNVTGECPPLTEFAQVAHRHGSGWRCPGRGRAAACGGAEQP